MSWDVITCHPTGVCPRLEDPPLCEPRVLNTRRLLEVPVYCLLKRLIAMLGDWAVFTCLSRRDIALAVRHRLVCAVAISQTQTQTHTSKIYLLYLLAAVAVSAAWPFY